MTISHLSFNELCLKKEIIWMSSVINIPTKAAERSTIQILFRKQDLNLKIATIHNPRQNSQLIDDPQCFQNPGICSIYGKNPQSMRFFRSDPSIRKPTHFPPTVRTVLLVSYGIVPVESIKRNCRVAVVGKHNTYM